MEAFVLVCGFLSTCCALYVGIPYMLTIIRGETRPQQYAWLVFAIMDFVIVISQYLEGATLSILAYVVFTLYSTIIFGLSLKYGVRDSSRFDRILLIGSIVTLIVWIATKNNVVAIWATVFIDVFATTILILKIKRFPGTEPFHLWFIGTMAMVFSCLTLINKPFGTLYIRPLYGVISDAVILIAIVYFKYVNKRSSNKKVAGHLHELDEKTPYT